MEKDPHPSIRQLSPSTAFIVSLPGAFRFVDHAGPESDNGNPV